MGNEIFFADLTLEQLQIIFSRVDFLDEITLNAFLDWTDGRGWWEKPNADTWFAQNSRGF